MPPYTSPRRLLPLPALLLFLPAAAVAADDAVDPVATFQQNCVACHNAGLASGGINLQELAEEAAFGADFKDWQKVIGVLEEKRMPPQGLPPVADAAREHALAWIRDGLDRHIRKHAGDPGRVTVRRLTSAEYAYSIKDLTGLDIRPDFSSDSVGGEGFTNFGDVQFMLDATLERYLDSAKKVADHAVIGAGPLRFYRDPGKSGFELAAIHKIQDLYQDHGFRAAAAEGGVAFGMWRYANACYAAWRYRNRKRLGLGDKKLAELAAAEDISPRFAQHIWSVLNRESPTFPLSEAVAIFDRLPPAGATEAEVRDACDDFQMFVINWPRRLFAAGELAKGGAGDERALVIDRDSIAPQLTAEFQYSLRHRGRGKARLYFHVVPVNPRAAAEPFTVWKNATVRFMKDDRSAFSEKPLREALTREMLEKVDFGVGPKDAAIPENAFVVEAGELLELDVEMPEEAVGLRIDIEVEARDIGDAVLRTTISGDEEASRGRPMWALLGDPKSPGFHRWRDGVLDFAANLPQVSQGEPTPADRDPIPPPFDNTYNQPERDWFHQRIKYYRRDDFLMEKMLDDATREELEHAWADLLTSFEYHDAFLRFVAEKFDIELGDRRMANIDKEWIASLPAEPRRYIAALKAEYDWAMAERREARPGHVEDAIDFAAAAWRRPLTAAQKAELRTFYERSRQDLELNHEAAIRALITRILVAPSFLYRLETPAEVSDAAPLSDWEMASRLSYFLWASPPDVELREAAAKGELSEPEELRAQVRRMLADEKARRFATEFFGQWLGFYRFDEYRGVDATRFPGFDAELRESMYDEAISFFEYIVRQDRPIRELIFADYAFLNEPLADHYGVDREVESEDRVVRVENTAELERGGLLRLGAVLTATSAPLRTSPVKRGDWVLRRVLGTPTPPPPPDAGSLPADEKAFGDLTIFEKLEAHKRNPTCYACHSRIDPLGFPLERYDAVGRWRDVYADGNAIHDSGVLFDGTEVSGIDGLLDYLAAQDEQVRRNLATKLVGYALGRTVLASDSPLIERLVELGDDATFADLAETIVTSKQFRFRQGVEGVTTNDEVDVAGLRPETPGGVDE